MVISLFFSFVLIAVLLRLKETWGKPGRGEENCGRVGKRDKCTFRSTAKSNSNPGRGLSGGLLVGLGALLGVLGMCLGAFGRSSVLLGPSWNVFGHSWVLLDS